MRKYNVLGVGHALVDILVDITDDEFHNISLEKGSMNLVDEVRQEEILAGVQSIDSTLASGGSVANSVIAVSQLGGKAEFCGRLGDDTYGQFFRSEFEQLGIQFKNPLSKGSQTGTCLVLITPDAERTMNTCLAISAELNEHSITKEEIQDAEWLYIEGYLLSEKNTGCVVVERAVEIARECGTKIAVTFSDGFIVDGFRPMLDHVVDNADLVFANHNEAARYTGINDDLKAFEKLKTLVPNVVLTRSEKGVLIHYGGESVDIPAFPCEPVDLTGAGDIFSGGFLYGVTNGYSVADSGKAACYLAMKVITQVGARLHGNLPKFWQEALSA
ncbi:MAG: adenosine kinase [Deltaproteobacteria bacterium]|nr:adenosine kinase [Deltaproteobacteria bacterium]